MALTQVENVYLGHDNSIDLILKANSTAINTSTVTTVRLAIGKTIITSTNSSNSPIRWNGDGYLQGEIRLYLGNMSSVINPGKYDAKIIIYGSTFTSGLVWDDNIPIRVIKNPETT